MAAPRGLTSIRYAVPAHSPVQAASSQVRCDGIGMSWLAFTTAKSAREPKLVSNPQASGSSAPSASA